MSLQIKVESASGSITLDTADLQTSLSTLRSKDGSRVGEEIVWRVKAFLSGADPDEVFQKRKCLEQILSDEMLKVSLVDGATVLDKLDKADVTEGPQFLTLTADGEEISRRISVAFELRGILFDATGNIVEASLTTEHIWDEEVYGRRVFGVVRVRDGGDAYSAALRYQPLLPVGGRWLRRRIAVTSPNSAEFEFHYTTAPVPLPQNVSFSRRIIGVEEKDGRRFVEYEAEFRGRGAEEAAERFRPEGKLIYSRTVREEGVVRVRYRVMEGGERDVVVTRRFTVRGGGRRVKAIGGGRKVAVFVGGVVPVEVEENGEAIRLNQVPNIVPPLKLGNMVLAERRYEVEPETLDTVGDVVAWRMRWWFRYVVKDGVDDTGGLLLRLLSASSVGG